MQVYTLKSVYICKRKQNQSCKLCAGDDFCKNAKLAPGADFAIVVSVWNRVPVSISVSRGSVCAVRHRDARRQISMSRGHACHRSSPAKVWHWWFWAYFMQFNYILYKLEILALQTRKPECNCNYHKLWFNSWCRRKLAIKIWVGELWVLKIYVT